MSKRNEDEKSKQDREIGLLKVQIYADRCHNKFISLLTIPWALFISFSIVFFTLCLENTISIGVFLGLEILVGVFLFYETYATRKNYKKDLKNVSEMIEIVKEGKELPRLEDLRDMGKDEKKRFEMRISSKQKRWLTKEMIFNCIVVSLAIIVFAFILELARMVFSTDLSMIARAIFLLFIWGLLSGAIWLLGFTAPDLMDIVFQMLGFKEKEEKKQKKGNDQNS